MSMIRMLIGIPIIAIILIFAFVNNDLITFNLWPLELEVTVSFSVVVVSLVLFGFVWGKISSWLAYLPLRKDLLVYKRQNKKLCKENQKVCEEVVGLKGSLKAKDTTSVYPVGSQAQVEVIKTDNGLKNKLVKLFKSPKK